MATEPAFIPVLMKLVAGVCAGWRFTIMVSLVLLLVAAGNRLSRATRLKRLASCTSTILQVFWCTPLLLWGVQTAVGTILTMSITHAGLRQLENYIFTMAYSAVLIVIIQCSILTIAFGLKGPRRLRADILTWTFVFGALAIVADLGLILYVVFKAYQDFPG
jgi:hypothetical protein